MSLSLETISHKKVISPASFIVPVRLSRSGFRYDDARVVVVIPTYAPAQVTKRLVSDILKWNPKAAVCVVDDSTPREHVRSAKIFKEFSGMRRVTLLRTPSNALKAGALNHALRHLEDSAERPDVIITADDDVVIAPTTIRNLVVELMSHEELGAACSQCAVYNKDANLLTRLQGLEYVGFNAIRLADEGFLRGPLVMHGMLTAFRAGALYEVGGFTEGHLIEDYEITTRLKERGWSVKSVQNAAAWTVVPESLYKFWRQRTRWSYGGVTVVVRARQFSTVFQDALGHIVFLSTIGMVLLLLLSRGTGVAPHAITNAIIALSFLQLGVWYVFQLWLMRSYKQKDLIDWLLRALLVPEFIYGFTMTFALLGSYAFFLFNMTVRAAVRSQRAFLIWLATVGTAFFNACGYTEGKWGTLAVVAKK